MERFLVQNENEFVALFSDPKKFDINDAEDFLGVEFAYVDGTYQSDMWKIGPDGKEIIINEDQDIDRKVWRQVKAIDARWSAEEPAQFPTQYPCLVLLANEKGSDRLGKFQFKLLEFVYLSELIKKPNIPFKDPEDESEDSAFTKGWLQAVHGLHSANPYDISTKENIAYNKGFNNGVE